MLLNKETLQAAMEALSTKPNARAASCLSGKEAGKDKPVTVCVYWDAPGKNELHLVSCSIEEAHRMVDMLNALAGVQHPQRSRDVVRLYQDVRALGRHAPRVPYKTPAQEFSVGTVSLGVSQGNRGALEDVGAILLQPVWLDMGHKMVWGAKVTLTDGRELYAHILHKGNLLDATRSLGLVRKLFKGIQGAHLVARWKDIEVVDHQEFHKAAF